MESQDTVTVLLQRWQEGDLTSLDALLPLVYDDLRRMAAKSLRQNSGHDTLQPTALVNEVFLRLMNTSQLVIEDRSHLFSVAARVMRQVLVDRARAHLRTKRGGADWIKIDFDDALNLPVEESSSLIALHDALSKLEALDPQMAEIVELRYFAGLSVADVAVLFGVEERTIYRQWAMARAWLRLRLES